MRKRSELCRLGALARSSGGGQARRKARAEAAARRAADRALGHRHRELAARSLYDLRQAHPQAARARSRRSVARRGRSRHRHPRRAERLHQGIRGRAARRSDRAHSSRSAPSISPRSKIIPRRAPSGGRASSASPAGLPAGRRYDAPMSQHSTAEVSRQDRYSARRARVHVARPRRSHRAARRRRATPFSTTRPDRCRARSRCASAYRRSSRWKPRSCARGGFPDIPAGASIAELVYVSLKRRRPRRRRACRSTSRTATPNFHADRALAKLKAVAARFEDEQQPYLPLVLSMWKNRYGTYDHLARVKEWSVGRTG